MTGSESVQPAPAEPAADWRRALPRLWCLLRTGAIRPASTSAATLVMGAATSAAWIAIDWWERGPEPKFAAAGVPLLAWYALAVLLLAAVLRRHSMPAPPYRDALTLATGLLPVLLLIDSIAVVYFESASLLAICIACGAYSLLYLARGLRALTGQAQRLAVSAGVLLIVGFIWASDAFDAIPDVWNPADAEPAAQVRDGGDEDLLFEQAARIDRSLALVHRDAGPKPEAFFLGFAGVGNEKVFAGEIDLAARTLGERFEFASRQVRLINDERDLERSPLATVSGLRYALRGIAARMRPDRDVLFLSISSHGSPDGIIAVSNSGLPLKDLDDQDLADALRDSGIEWRVIVISACYAGAFIDSLRDARTIVITAAAADRTSFGCSNDRDLTYFGEAFYRDALPKARSLRAAFEQAKAALAAREQREKVTPSEPQAFFGAEIERKLDAGIASTTQ
jgi:hypothetical protein